MLNKQEQVIFFELLRSALWEREPDLSVFSGDWAWESILSSFNDHALLGVVADTITNLSPEYLPNVEQQQLIFLTVANLIQTHKRQDLLITKLFAELETVGCQPILLKGQGLAALYPKRCIRSCGDIDIYVCPVQFEKAKAVMNDHADTEEIAYAEEIEAEHHYKITIEGTIIELHHLAGDPGNPKYKTQFQQNAAAYLVPEKCDKITIDSPNGKVSVLVPSKEFNVWYIFNHLVHHFAGQGVGLRQFCDWLIVLKNYNPQPAITLNLLTHNLKNIGLLRAWKILGGILVNQFGFPAALYPAYDAKQAHKSQGFILRELIEGKNFRFGSYNTDLTEQKHGLRRVFSALYACYRGSRPLVIVSRTYSFRVFLKMVLYGINGIIYRHFHVSFMKINPHSVH